MAKPGSIILMSHTYGNNTAGDLAFFSTPQAQQLEAKKAGIILGEFDPATDMVKGEGNEAKIVPRPSAKA